MNDSAFSAESARHSPSTKMPNAVAAVFPFLDTWRVIAALMVVFLHLQMQDFLPAEVPHFRRVGHLAVIVFFVISGYSVAFSAHQHQGQIGKFLVARWSRIYSIAIPAILVALVLDQLAGIQNSPLYPAWQYPKWWQHLLFNSLFLGEHWAFKLHPFSLAPYWSLSYEFWFYALMAVFMLDPSRLRAFSIIAMLLFFGPRICALLPCWLLGVWAFRKSLSSPGTIPHAGGLASISFLFVGGLWLVSGADTALLATSKQIDDQLQSATGNLLKLYESRYFLADVVIAIFFAMAILVTARTLPAKKIRMPRLQAWVSWLAPHTFALYLFHYTFIAFATTKIAPSERHGLTTFFVASLVIGSSLLLGVLLAPTRKLWAQLLDRALHRVGRLFGGSTT